MAAAGARRGAAGRGAEPTPITCYLRSPGCLKFPGGARQDGERRGSGSQGPYSGCCSMGWLRGIALLSLGVLLAGRVNCQHVKNNVPRLKLSYKGKSVVLSHSRFASKPLLLAPSLPPLPTFLPALPYLPKGRLALGDISGVKKENYLKSHSVLRSAPRSLNTNKEELVAFADKDSGSCRSVEERFAALCYFIGLYSFRR